MASTYIAVFRLGREKRIGVGALGEIDFKPGLYAYVGSAKKGMAKRLERHASRDKKLHWHVDYLSMEAEFVKALLSSLGECETARNVGGMGGVPIPNFGCSDCSCPSHLFFFEKMPERWR